LSSSKKNKFDVVIPTYNNLEELKICLHKLENQTFNDFRVLICVDGSTDGTKEFLSTANYPFQFDVIFHPSGKHKGRNPTRNLSLPYLKAEYLLLLDSDMIPQTDFLERHHELLTHQNCVSLGNIEYINADKNIVADYIMSRGKNKYQDGDVLSCRYFNSGNVAFKTYYFIELKGQDPEMETYGGGVEFGIRFEKKFKLSVIFNEQAFCQSVLNKNLTFVLNQMREFGAVNLPYLRKKHPDYQDVFRWDVIESGKLTNRLLRLFLINPIGWLVKRTVQVFPRKVRQFLIHYLFFLNIYQGYRTRINKT